MESLNAYELAILRNAEWFISRQREEGYIDAEGDEFYGIRGDATLVGHSVTVRMYAYALTGRERFLVSARRSLEWLAARQDVAGGWKRHAAYTLDGAQCVFEGFNTYRQLTRDPQFDDSLTRAADRMISGTVDDNGDLMLLNIIEIGEYAHFSMLAWKTTGDERYRRSGEAILGHIMRNFDEDEGFWCPFDRNAQLTPGQRFARRAIGQILRGSVRALPIRGRRAARLAEHLLPLVAASSRPQYSMSLMDAEVLIDTLDDSCSFPELRRQTTRAIDWVLKHCRGPTPGTVVESRPTRQREHVYPLAIVNDTELAATWPTSCLLLAYCGLNEARYREAATQVADWLVSIQDEHGAFYNFQKPDGTFLPLQSGNVNFYASMSLWVYNEVYGDGPKLLTRRNGQPAATEAILANGAVDNRAVQ
jgi:hypothetical protein